MKATYLLVDSYGSPYKGVGLDAVKIEAGADVSDLKDAVLIRNRSLLSPAQLMVYRRREDILDPAVEPLDPTLLINDANSATSLKFFIVIPGDDQISVKYHLVDECGNPYKGSHADLVKIDRYSNVSNLKDAVLAKNNRGLLAGLSAPQIIVFRRKEDITYPTAEPLDDYLSLNDVGPNETHKEFFIVVCKAKTREVIATDNIRYLKYHLVDESGNSYEGSYVDAVKIDRYSKLSDLRDAVLAKNKDSLLAGVSASHLMVCKRSEGIVHSKEEPLDLTLSINDAHLCDNTVYYIVVRQVDYSRLLIFAFLLIVSWVYQNLAIMFGITASQPEISDQNEELDSGTDVVFTSEGKENNQSESESNSALRQRNAFQDGV